MSDLEACRQALVEPIEVDFPIGVYFQQVEDTIQFSQDEKTPFTPAQILQTAYHAFNKTELYSLTLKECHKKVMADKTWSSFLKVSAEEYHDLVEETKVNSRVAGFHYANAMQEIGGALEHISMVVGTNKEIVTKLTEAVE